MDETGQTPIFDEDPNVADFLAREQDEFAMIGDDLIGGNSGTNVSGPTGESLIQEADDIIGISSESTLPINPYAAISQMDETPDCIRQWREEKDRMLAEKDAAEAEAMEELRLTAQKELQDWYNHFEDQQKHIKDANRQAEEAFVQERDTTVPGHEWEKVARMCDFNPKSNKNTKDVSRMRSMFLQLKQTPPVR